MNLPLTIFRLLIKNSDLASSPLTPPEATPETVNISGSSSPHIALHLQHLKYIHFKPGFMIINAFHQAQFSYMASHLFLKMFFYLSAAYMPNNSINLKLMQFKQNFGCIIYCNLQ